MSIWPTAWRHITLHSNAMPIYGFLRKKWTPIIVQLKILSIEICFSIHLIHKRYAFGFFPCFPIIAEKSSDLPLKPEDTKPEDWFIYNQIFGSAVELIYWITIQILQDFLRQLAMKFSEMPVYRILGMLTQLSQINLKSVRNTQKKDTTKKNKSRLQSLVYNRRTKVFLAECWKLKWRNMRRCAHHLVNILINCWMLNTIQRSLRSSSHAEY